MTGDLPRPSAEDRETLALARNIVNQVLDGAVEQGGHRLVDMAARQRFNDVADRFVSDLLAARQPAPAQAEVSTRTRTGGVMTEIATVEELDALPVGSVVRVTGVAWPRPGVAERVDGGWAVTEMSEVMSALWIMSAGATAVVLCRPDAPALDTMRDCVNGVRHDSPPPHSRHHPDGWCRECGPSADEAEALVIGHDAMYEAIEDSPNLDEQAKAEVLTIVDHLAARQPAPADAEAPADDLDQGAVAMVREHYRVECALDDPKTRLYRSHVSTLLDALTAARAGEPAAPTVSADDLDPAAVEPLDLDGGLPDVYYDIRSRNNEWTTATGPVPRSTYLMDTEVLLLLVARLEAALTAARRDALAAARQPAPVDAAAAWREG